MTKSGAPLDHLLEPSLQRENLKQPIYSDQAGFIVAFAGGVFASLIFSGLNIHRLRRWSEDGWVLAMLGLLATALSVLMAYWMSMDSIPSALEVLGEGTRGLRNTSRLIALGAFIAFFLRHRRFQKTRDYAGEDAPSPWLPGIGACVAGSVLAMIVAFGGFFLGNGVPTS